ncbi:glycosyltransferase [Methanosarcina sp. 1.H.A.2.2]|uniref:glycosyltransferase n=1 Tax=Methanosarcina sp. 1.H.A.2.2 TaxID=1483601 RepID=UPI0006224AED|nr:glycosyltransferase [Methanosarcina sp. 1.H.A.2.2]KKH47431.1 hypothetical protein EO93_01255 [Methanosarcina sp. 1.H.A.2.2]
MKVAVISAFPPTKDNLGAPTALPYQILKYAPDNVDIELFYYPASEKYRSVVSKDLKNLRLKSVEIPSPNIFMQKYSSYRAKKRGLPWGVGGFPVNKKIIKEINNSNPDYVWIYPHWLIDWIPLIKCKKIIVTGPDSAALHCERAIRFGKWNSCKEVYKKFRSLKENINLEKKYGSMPVKLHLVGKEDVAKYISLTNRTDQAFFIPHPYYDYTPIETSIVNTKGKIRILISGGGDTVYVGDHLAKIIKELIRAAQDLLPHYEFLFLGKGYNDSILDLQNSGFSVAQKNWVDDYANEIAKCQIQLFPIAVGTGTKGKVLQALASGLLGIGSEFAFENIGAVPYEDYILYHKAEDVTYCLKDLIANRLKYEKIAISGSQKVVEKHSPEWVCKLFWEVVLVNS